MSTKLNKQELTEKNKKSGSPNARWRETVLAYDFHKRPHRQPPPIPMMTGLERISNQKAGNSEENGCEESEVPGSSVERNIVSLENNKTSKSNPVVPRVKDSQADTRKRSAWDLEKATNESRIRLLRDSREPSIRQDPKLSLKEGGPPKKSMKETGLPKISVSEDFVIKKSINQNGASKMSLREDGVPKKSVREVGIPKSVKEEELPKKSVKEDGLPKKSLKENEVPKKSVRDFNKQSTHNGIVPAKTVPTKSKGVCLLCSNKIKCNACRSREEILDVPPSFAITQREPKKLDSLQPINLVRSSGPPVNVSLDEAKRRKMHAGLTIHPVVRWDAPRLIKGLLASIEVIEQHMEHTCLSCNSLTYIVGRLKPCDIGMKSGNFTMQAGAYLWLDKIENPKVIAERHLQAIIEFPIVKKEGSDLTLSIVPLKNFNHDLIYKSHNNIFPFGKKDLNLDFACRSEVIQKEQKSVKLRITDLLLQLDEANPDIQFWIFSTPSDKSAPPGYLQLKRPCIYYIRCK